MRRKCANPGCTEFYSPSKATRKHEPFCSPACHDQVVRGYSPTLSLATVQPSAPLPTRKLVNRKHGIDYRGRDD